jgi:hypothetical protein
MSIFSSLLGAVLGGLGESVYELRHRAKTFFHGVSPKNTRMLWNSDKHGTYVRAKHGELLVNGKPRNEFI